MAQATLVWQLSRRLARAEATPAQRLIDVYETYRWLEAQPLLNIMRVAFVPHLVAAQEWQAVVCRGIWDGSLTVIGTGKRRKILRI